MELLLFGYVIYALLLFISVQWIRTNVRDEAEDARTAHHCDHHRTNEYIVQMNDRLLKTHQSYQTNLWGLNKELSGMKCFLSHVLKPNLYWKESYDMDMLKAIVTLPKKSSEDTKEFVIRITADGGIKAITKNGKVSAEIELPATTEIFEFTVKRGTPAVSVGVACRDYAGNTGDFTWSEPRDAVDNTAPPAPDVFSAAFESVAEDSDLPFVGEDTLPDTIPITEPEEEGGGDDIEPQKPR
ncbi:MAG: hypothetical protein LBQ54_16005 [Planctomycetaceae bacterium]|jgi:hypothetical protein|nr:hypothetical protein [Planctomycetaceae bacterium]